MAVLRLPLRTPAAVTAPTDIFPVTLPTAETVRFFDGLPVSFAELPSLGAVAIANGVDPLRLVVNDDIIDAGLQAPKTAPSASAGAEASTRFDSDNGGAYTIVDGDTVRLVTNNVQYNVTWRTSLSVVPVSPEVLIGANTAAALANLKKYVNGTGIEGTDYKDWGGSTTVIRNSIEATTLTSTDLTLVAKASGVVGNSYVCTYTGGAGPRFEEAAANVAQTVFSGGTDASGTEPAAGAYLFAHQSHRTVDNALSARSPTASIETLSAQNISLTGLTANDDTTADFTRVLRSTAGGDDLYRDQDIARAGTTATSSVSNAILQERGIPIYNPAEYRSYREGLPVKGRYVCLAKDGRLWTAGAVLAADFTHGTAAVTQTTDGADNDTVTISGNGAVLDANMVNRTFQVTGTAEKYRILKVAVATGIITLDRGYEGATNASASYTIRDDRDPTQLYCSEPNKFSQWPSANNPGGVQTDDAEGCTGLFSSEGVTYGFSRTSISEVVGSDPLSWQMRTVVDGSGCVSGHTIQGTPFGAVWLGAGAIYLWNLQGQPIPASTSATGRKGRPHGIDRTFDRISWAHIHQAFATPYDETTKTVRFFVPMDGAEVPSHAIVFDVANLGIWVVDLVSEVTAGCSAVHPNGKTITLLGDSLGNLKHDGLATTVDEAFGFVATQTLSGAQTVRTLTVTGTPLPTSGDGLKGVGVTVVYASGATAYRKIASNTSSTVTLSRDLDTAPSAADQIAIGCIDCDLETGRFAPGSEWGTNGLRDVVTLHAPEAVSAATDTTKEYHFAYAANQDTVSILTRGFDRGDLTDAKGRRRFRTQRRAYLHKLRWRCLDPEAEFALRGFILLHSTAAPDPEGGG